MSINPSNLYAEKLLSEHPLAIWSLDDNSDYISLISESFRDISNWSIISGTLSSVSSSGSPFPQSYTTSIVGTATPTKDYSGITYLKSSSNFTSDSDGFTISLYIKTSNFVELSCGFGGLTATIYSISRGNGSNATITYTTTSSHGFVAGDYVEVTGTTAFDGIYNTSGYVSSVGLTSTSFRIVGVTGSGGSSTQTTSGIATEGRTSFQTINPVNYLQDSWIPVSFTFPYQATSKKMILSFTYNDVNPTYYVNGLTIGKNSEPFNGESFGKSLITLPTSIATNQTQGLECKNFGTKEYSAYYIGSGNNLYSKNAGMSMSYGSENSMIVYPHSTVGEPSFIFPAFGMLNDIGRYKEITFEALIRINADNSIPKRIIGPLASTDGIYVTKDFIMLKVGDNVGSYYTSELFSPMVLQMQMGNNYANLTINGEEVILLQINNSSLSLPSEYSNASKNQNWFGIYAYSDIKTIEVDSIAFYPYKCSAVLAKRRLVFAQGLEPPEIANLSYNGKTILTDYKYANYNKNYNYPSFQAKWEQASINENFEINNNLKLSSKIYLKPLLDVSAYSTKELLQDVYATNIASAEPNVFMNLKPSTVVSGSGRSWSSVYGNILLSQFDKNLHLSNCVYGVFKSLETSSSEQVLIKIIDTSNSNYFKISLTGTTVSYKYCPYGQTEINVGTASITQGSLFVAGIDIKKLILSNTQIANFFANKQYLVVSVGASPATDDVFSGNIYKVGLCSEINFVDISSLFDSSGIIENHSSYSQLLAKTTSYMLSPVIYFNSFDLVIGSNSYWQDYVPLTKLSKNYFDVDGKEKNGIDFIQLNIDYAEPKAYSSGNFDTSSQSAKTYITFQTLESGANKDLSSFSTTVSANENRVIDATTFNDTTKYEFVNGMIVYPPTNIDIDTLAMVIHIDLNIDNTNLKQFNFKNLEIAAQTFNKNIPNRIGTKYGIDIYPYPYNTQNPYLINKKDTPYLYLTRHSGIRVVGNGNGFYINVGNPSEKTRISSMQMSILSDIKEFPTNPVNFLSMQGNKKTIDFYVQATNADKTEGIIYTDYLSYTNSAPNYYLNGKRVATPTIKLNEWNVLGIAFREPFDVSNTIGKINVYSKLLVNNISYYNANPIEIDQKSTSLLWSDVSSNSWSIVIPTQTPTRSGNSITLNTTGNHNLVVGEIINIAGIVPTSYQNNGGLLVVQSIPSPTSFTYQNSLASTSPITTAGTVVGTWQYSSIPNYYQISSNNIKNIYKIYLGTYKNVIDATSDSKRLMFNGYQYIVYSDIEIKTTTLSIV